MVGVLSVGFSVIFFALKRFARLFENFFINLTFVSLFIVYIVCRFNPILWYNIGVRQEEII